MNHQPQIIEQTGIYSIRRAAKGFEVYRDEGVASVRCARIGYEGDKGLDRARLEIAKRQAA